MNKRKIILFLKLAITAAAITYLFRSGKFRVAQLAVESGGWPWIGAAAGAVLLWMVLSQVRHWGLLRAGGAEVGVGKVIRFGFISWFFNATLLGGLGFLSADAIKAGYLMGEKAGGGVVISSTLLDRVLGTLGLMTLAVFALQVGWEETVQSDALRSVAGILYGVFAAAGLATILSVVALAENRVAAVVAWILMGGAAAIMLAQVWDAWLMPALIMLFPLAVAMLAPLLLPGSGMHRAIIAHLWKGERISAFLKVLTDYRRKVGALLMAYGISIVIHLAAMSALFFAGRGISLEDEPTFRQVWFAAPAATLLNILPLPANGLGVGEATFDAMLRLCAGRDGNPLEGGAALYLSYRILMTLLGLTGLPFYLATPKRPGTSG